MKKEEIKTLEDAMTFIDEMEKVGQDNKTHLVGLQNKVSTLEKEKESLTKENGDLKAKYYDLWTSQPRIDNTKQEETKEETVKSLDELLLEE